MSLNKVILMGRLTKDPELRHTTNDIPVVSFTLAVEDSYSKDKVYFVDIVAWRNTARFVEKYFHKGQLVAVEGSLQSRTYTDKDGKTRKAVEVVASSVYFTGDRHTASAPDLSESNLELEEVVDDDSLPF